MQGLDSDFAALVVLIFVQAAGTVWWAATLSARVKAMEGKFEAFDGDQRRMEASFIEMKVSIALLDQRFSQVIAGMAKVDERLASMEHVLLEGRK